MDFRPLVTIRTEDRNVATVVHVQGELDLSTAPQFQETMVDVIQSGRPVVVSISDVTYIDMSVFRALEAAKRALRPAQPMALVASPPNVHRIIEIIQFSQVMPIFPTVEAALAAVNLSGDTA